MDGENGMNKFDRFWEAEKASRVVEEVNKTFGKWGGFHIDNADVILEVAKLENVSPELIAVTWLNETSFRFYSEPNTNNQPDNFLKHDVGPMQLNVYYTLENIKVKFINPAGIDISRALGSKSNFFNGSPKENVRLGARTLGRIGRGEIEGPRDSTMFPKLSVEHWNSLSLDDKNLRRAVAYTGPDARTYRLKSWQKFYPMFKQFFEIYEKEG
jgi:hypothetical protein